MIKYDFEKMSDLAGYKNASAMFEDIYKNSRNTIEAAKKMGIHPSTFCRQLKKYKIPAKVRKGTINIVFKERMDREWEEWAENLGYNSVKDMIVDGYSKSNNLGDYAFELGVCEGVLVRKMKELKIERRSSAKAKKERLKKLKKMMDDNKFINMTTKDLAKLLGVTTTSILTYKRELGFIN